MKENDPTMPQEASIYALSSSSTQLILCWTYERSSSSSSLRSNQQRWTPPSSWSRLPSSLQQRLLKRKNQLEGGIDVISPAVTGGTGNTSAITNQVNLRQSWYPSTIDRWHVQFSPRYLGRWLEWDANLRVPFCVINGLEPGASYSIRVRARHVTSSSSSSYSSS